MNGSDEQNTSIPTSDQMRQEIDKRLQGDALSNAFEIKKENGQDRWMGVALSPELATLLNSAFTVVKPVINKQGGAFLYDKASDAVLWYDKNAGNKAHRVGLTAAKLFMGAIIASQPIDQLIHTRKVFKDSRKELFSDLEPILQSDQQAYKNNTVIKNALDRIHSDAAIGLKKVVADIPAIGLTTYFAVRDYSGLRDRKNAEFGSKQIGSKPDTALHDEFVRRDKERGQAIRNSVAEYEAELKAGGYKDKKLEAELDRFEARAWAEYDKKDSVQHTPQGPSHDGMDMTTVAMTGGAAVSHILRSKVGASGKADDVLAWDMIKQLRKDNENSSIPDLSERILAIFQENEQDQGLPAIGDKLLPHLQPAIDRIAKAISEEGLDPLALVNLVGDGKVVMHNNGERTFATVEQVNMLIDEQLKVLHTAERVTPEEFFTNFANPMFAQNTLKKSIEINPEIAALFPAQVVEKMGFDKLKVAEWQKQGHEQLYFLTAAIVMDLAAKEPEKLHKLGLNEADIQGISELAQKIDAGDLQALKVSVDGADKSVLAAARTAALNEQLATGQQPWTSRIEQSGAIRQKFETMVAKAVDAKPDGKAEIQPAEKSLAAREINRRDNEPSNDNALGV